MQPWVGLHYCHALHKRLLVVGESHYLPAGSTIHHDSEVWYASRQRDLNEKEQQWASTTGNITGRWGRAHTIYREIARVLNALINDLIPNEESVFDHVAYANYFLRPAPMEGESMAGYVDRRDEDVAAEVLTWFIRTHRPELIAVASKTAGRYAERILASAKLPYLITYYAGSPFWMTRFRDDFADFLQEHDWLAPSRIVVNRGDTTS